MVYRESRLKKDIAGKKAPKGFHYMPDGKLMNDADHIAAHGYIEKKINGIDMDYTDIPFGGGTRKIVITGDREAFFTVEVFDNSNSYYNFNTNSWSSSYSSLKNVEIKRGRRVVNVNFPENTSSLKTYTINIIAEIYHNIKTTHRIYKEHRNIDSSINVNLSTGSNSNIVKKILYQDVEKSLYLSCIAPSKYDAVTAVTDGATSSSNRVVLSTKAGVGVGGTKGIQVHDNITSTDSPVGVWLRVKETNPDDDNEKELELTNTESFADARTLTFTPPFNGVTPHDDDSTSGRNTTSISSGGSVKEKFSITITAGVGRNFLIKRLPTIKDLCAYTTVTIGSAASAIEGENTSSDTLFYRWPINNVAGLKEGMTLDPSRAGGGTNTITPAELKAYTIKETVQVMQKQEHVDILVDKSSITKHIPAIGTLNNDVTSVDRNGRITAIAGNVIFSRQQHDALKSDSNVRIFGHGKAQIQALTGMEVDITDVELVPTQVTATTNAAVDNSTTVAISSAEGVGNVVTGMTVRGVNIAAGAANPTVVSKSANIGAANIVLSAAQTLEAGQTLYFDGRSNILTLTGTIEVSKFPLADTTLYFDLERFLTCT